MTHVQDCRQTLDTQSMHAPAMQHNPAEQRQLRMSQTPEWTWRVAEQDTQNLWRAGLEQTCQEDGPVWGTAAGVEHIHQTHVQVASLRVPMEQSCPEARMHASHAWAAPVCSSTVAQAGSLLLLPAGKP